MAFLLMGNQAPTPAESERLQAYIDAGESELHQIDRATAELAHQRESVVVRIKKWRTALCTIRRLPPEILSEIFHFWVQQGDHEHGPLLHTPFLLGQVCSGWRKFVLNTPTLWTKVAVRTRPKLQITDASMELFKTYLERSQACPFTASFTVRFREAVPNGFPRLLEALRPHLARLGSLTLFGPISIYRVLQSFPEDSRLWPILRSLSITIWDTNEPEIDARLPFATFANASQLQEVKLVAYGPTGKRLLRELTLPWSQIVTLNTQNVFDTASSARRILLQAPSLKQCSLGTVRLWPGNAFVPTLPVETFSDLNTFDVTLKCEHGQDEHGAARFFQPLEMPALSRLTIAIYNPNEEVSETSAFIKFIYSRSGSTLTHLSLDATYFEDGQIAKILGLLPNLESLHTSLTAIASTDELFLALTYPEPPQDESSSSPASDSSIAYPLLPRLESLRIFEYPLYPQDSVTASVVVDMISSRWWSDEELTIARPTISRLKEVNLQWDDGGNLDLNEAQIDRLLLCREEGMDVWVDGMEDES